MSALRRSAWSFFIAAFTISFVPIFALSTPAFGASVNEVRAGLHTFGARIVLDLSGPAAYRLKVSEDGRQVFVHLPDADWDMSESDELFDAWPLESFSYEPSIDDGASGGVLVLQSTTPTKILKHFTLTPSQNWGHRLVFDVGEAPDSLQSTGVPGREGRSAAARPLSLRPTEPSSGTPSPTPKPSDLVQGLPQIATEPLVPPVAASESSGENEARFILTDAIVDGATAFNAADLRTVYAGSIGQKVSLSGLRKMAETMTARYRNAGYILSKVIVPEQQVADGRVRFQAIEGYIDKVLIEGQTEGRKDLWDAWRAKLKAERPTTAKVMERYTLLANDLAGASVKSVLRPSKTQPGASDLILKVVHKTWDVSATIDNRASPSTGPFEGTVSASASSLFGQYTKSTLTLNATKDPSQSNYIAGQVEGMLNAEGLAASFSGSFSKSAPGDALKDLDLQSETLQFAAGLSYPLIRTRDHNLSVSAGVSAKSVKSDALSARLYDDQLRLMNLGASYGFKDGWQGENALSLGYDQGFGILGASEADTDLRSRTNGQTDFFKVTGSYSRLQALPRNLSLSATFSGQWASAPLLASEEFSFGGSSFGRAYDSSEITGDHGMALALELQHTTKPKIRHLKYLQGYVFWDFGVTWDIDADDDTAKRTGASAGAGLRVGITDYITGNLELALPLTRDVSTADDGEGNDPRVFFSLSTTY